MKKIIIICFVISVWTTICLAGVYFSPSGFAVNVLSHWTILNAERLKDNPLLYKVLDVVTSDKKVKEEAKRLIDTGQLEFWFYRDTADNINVFLYKGNVPKTIETARKQQFMDSSSYDYGFRKIAGLDAFYVENDGVVYGTKSVQCFIQKAPNIMYVFTLTCDGQRIKPLRKEFWTILSSFKSLD
jgi:hypothetical protein